MRNFIKKQIPTHKSAVVFQEEAILVAIKNSFGIVSRVARNLETINNNKCDYHLAFKNIEYYQSCIDAMNNESEHVIDKSLDTLLKGLRDGDQSTAKWLLTKLDKKHWGDEVTLNGEATKITFVFPDNLTNKEQEDFKNNFD